jgi:FkbM family methyltransferase
MGRLSNNIKHHKNWFAYYLYKTFKKKKGEEFTFKWHSGTEVEVSNRMMHTYKECFFDETYLKGIPAEIKSASLRNVVDIGANVGYFSLSIFSNYPDAKVYAFEPVPINYEKLTAYKKKYPQYAWHPFNMAVTKPGETSIQLNFEEQTDDFTTSASIYEGSSSANHIEVKATNLPQIISEHNLQEIDLLKVDCEGSEYDILYNTGHEVFEKVNAIAIETHEHTTKGHDTKTLAEYIEKAGYQIKVEKDIIWAWKSL